jgi:hypothetical protein
MLDCYGHELACIVLGIDSTTIELLGEIQEKNINAPIILFYENSNIRQQTENTCVACFTKSEISDLVDFVKGLIKYFPNEFKRTEIKEVEKITA